MPVYYSNYAANYLYSCLQFLDMCLDFILFTPFSERNYLLLQRMTFN